LSLCLNKHNDMQTCWGRRGITPCALNFVTRCRWVAILPPGKSFRYPFDRSGGSQSRSRRRGEEKNTHHCLYWEWNSGRPARILILYWLSLKGKEAIEKIRYNYASGREGRWLRMIITWRFKRLQGDSARKAWIRGLIQKFPDWPPGAITVNGTDLPLGAVVLLFCESV